MECGAKLKVVGNQNSDDFCLFLFASKNAFAKRSLGKTDRETRLHSHDGSSDILRFFEIPAGPGSIDLSASTV
jgi:hypothetical protein